MSTKMVFLKTSPKAETKAIIWTYQTSIESKSQGQETPEE